MADTKTEKKKRSYPSIEFTGSEAGAIDFPSSKSRKYNYYTPAKRRATTYEDVTFDVQPDPERHLSQGWIYGFANGPGGYPKEWTAIKSSDWHQFRDPNEEWEQTIYRNNAAVERQVSLNLENAKRAGAYRAWNKAWTTFVERNLGAWMHLENGLGLHVFTAIQRSAPTNMINNAMSVNATHKLRFAQDLAMYNLDLSEADIDFNGEAHKDVWQNEPTWQGVRQVAEEITAIHDWAECLFAANIVLEQLIGILFRSQLVMQISARNGDYVSPTIVGAGENDYARDLTYTRVLFQMLGKDEAHGEANRKLMSQWLDKYTPMCLDAANTLQPIWSQPHEKNISFAQSMEAAQESFTTLLGDLNLDTPKEIS